MPRAVRTDFTFTKSVFPHSDPHPSIPSKREPGLDDADYKKLIKEMHEAGVEIAYHGLSPRSHSLPYEVVKQRIDALAPFEPSTWIDHGTASYLFSRKNEVVAGISLTSILKDCGIRNYWSYYDIWNNPFRELSSWNPHEIWKLLEDLSSVAESDRLYHSKHIFNNIFGLNGFSALRQGPFSIRAWRDALRSSAATWNLRRAPHLIYGQLGCAYPLAIDDDWIFDTVLLNHAARQLNPASVDRLVKVSGLLLAHTYLSCHHDYVKGNVLMKSGGGSHISPLFIEALEHLQWLQRRRQIVTVSFASLRGALSAFSLARLRRTDSGWRAAASARFGPVGLSWRHGTMVAHDQMVRDGIAFRQLRPGSELTIRDEGL